MIWLLIGWVAGWYAYSILKRRSWIIGWLAYSVIYDRPAIKQVIREEFPFGQKNVPSYVICQTCGGPGWGPMLSGYLWDLWSYKFGVNPNGYMCERCMERLLGRPIQTRDIRACIMNINHPKFRYDSEVW